MARFDGGMISSDGGALLLAEVERRTRILERFASCFQDHRDSARIEHSAAELVKQRVLGLCLGYEDISDHDTLRDDSVLHDRPQVAIERTLGRQAHAESPRTLDDHRCSE